MDSEELSSSNMDEDSGDLSCTVDISSTEERMRKLVTNNQKKKDHDLTPVHSDSDFKGNQSGKESSADDSECDAAGIDKQYTIKELGCNDRNVMLNEEMLDQFIVLKAIMDKNMPKLLYKDMQILQHIVGDVFPNVTISQVISGKDEVMEIIN